MIAVILSIGIVGCFCGIRAIVDSRKIWRISELSSAGIALALTAVSLIFSL